MATGILRVTAPILGQNLRLANRHNEKEARKGTGKEAGFPACTFSYMKTVANIYSYLHVLKGTMRYGICSRMNRASHCWPGYGNTSITPLPIYNRRLPPPTPTHTYVTQLTYSTRKPTT